MRRVEIPKADGGMRPLRRDAWGIGLIAAFHLAAIVLMAWSDGVAAAEQVIAARRGQRSR